MVSSPLTQPLPRPTPINDVLTHCEFAPQAGDTPLSTSQAREARPPVCRVNYSAMSPFEQVKLDFAGSVRPFVHHQQRSLIPPAVMPTRHSTDLPLTAFQIIPCLPLLKGLSARLAF